jgi:hypothetical protein
MDINLERNPRAQTLCELKLGNQVPIGSAENFRLYIEVRNFIDAELQF